MSFQTLADVVGNKRRDDFEIGTVIRWTSGGQYTYCAIKTGIGWFTTARESNPYVAQHMNFDALLAVLRRSETTRVAVSTGWHEFDGPEEG